MRSGRRVPLILPLVLAAPALASGGAFETRCAESLPIASCSCMVDELRQSRDGRFFIHATDAMALPKDEQKQAMLEILNRYNMKMSDVTAMKEALEPMVQVAWERCK